MESVIHKARYVLAVRDLKKSASFYEHQLGFTTIWAGDGWHFLERGKFIVMLGECPDEKSAHDTGDHSYFAYLEVEHIDALHAELNAKGVEMISRVIDQPWGQREFGIRTVDGHRIMFGESIAH